MFSRIKSMTTFALLRVMEILKFTTMAQYFCPSSRCINGSILKYVPINATKKTGKKTRHMVYFIFSMTLSCLLLLLSWSPAQCSKNTDVMTIVSFGKRIINNSLPFAKQKAVSDALDLSVQRAVTRILTGADLTAALGLVYDTVLDDSQKYVVTYRVLAELTENNHYMVAVEAKINSTVLENFFTDYGIINRENEKPSILLLISEQIPGEILPRYWWGKNPLPYKSFAEGAVAACLTNRGFDLVAGYDSGSPAALDIAPGAEKTEINFDFIHDSEAAVKLGRHLKADIVVIGRAQAHEASNIMGDERSYKAVLAVEVFNIDTSERVTSVEMHGVAKSRTRANGTEKALISAGELAGEELALLIDRAWSKSKKSSKVQAIEVRIDGTDYLANFIMLRRVLNKMDGIDAVKTTELGADQAVVDIAFKGSAEKLADSLMLKTFDSFAIELSDITDTSLSIRFVPDNDVQPVSESDMKGAYISE
ncbi:MAG: hypothetical protein U9N77_04835 [Thermodesulfobacteriota bacterium]|nr:hypothetical protein [Thermodesulfobacteriota bacterium]